MWARTNLHVIRFAVNSDARSRDRKGIGNVIPTADRQSEDNISKYLEYEIFFNVRQYRGKLCILTF